MANQVMKMARLIRCGICAGCVLLALFFFNSEIPAAEPDEPVGEVVAVRGDVRAVDGSGASRALVLRNPVFRNDVLKTGPSGRVQVMFIDQTLISLGRDTEMEIVRYAWAAEKKSGAMTTRVKEGAFRVMGGAITRNSPENFTTETPVATIGVRGSLYSGLVQDEQVSILFQAGVGIDLITPFGNSSLNRPGYGSTVTAGRAPTPAQQFSPEEVRQLDNHFVSLEGIAGGGLSPPPGDGAIAPGQQPPPPAGNDGQPLPAGDGTVAGPLPPPPTDDGGTAPAPLLPPPPTSTLSEPLPPPPMNSAGPLPLPPPPLTTFRTELGQITNTIGSVQVVSTQTAVNTQITPIPLAFPSGRYLSTLIDDAFWYGPLSGGSTNGQFTGQSVAQDSTVFPVSYRQNAHFISAPYTGSTSFPWQSRGVFLRGGNRITTTMTSASDSRGEFGFFSSAFSFIDGVNYDFREFGFAGRESVALPANGFSSYFGEYLVAPRDSGTLALLSARTGTLTMVVNWFNHKAYGFVEETGRPIIQFFGDVAGNSLTNVTMISDGAEAMGLVKWHEGSGDFARFYGELGQGFGITGLGSTYDVDSQLLKESWRMAGAAFRGVAPSGVSPSGTITLDGMVVALSEDMTVPNSNRRHFMNHPFAGTPTTFSITVNRDTGTMTGQLNAIDLLDANNVLKNVAIGGGVNDSAYIDYNAAVARLGCAGNCVETGATPNTGGLKTYGNYLATDGGPTRAIAAHLSWGYWELAYTDPTSGNPYHLHVPYSLWIAGVKTPVAEVGTRIATNFSGRYLGKAYGSRVNATGFASELTGGVTDLTIDFSATAPTPVSGTLTFDQASMTVVGTVPVTTGGFQAQIGTAAIGGTGASAILTSEVNGFFYEPGATSMGGNFSAQRADGERLLGVMGGNL